VVDEDGGQLARGVGGATTKDGLVAGWPKTSRGEDKSGGTVELENRRDLAMATPRRVSLFIPQRKRNGHPNRLR
jgi:hypothetical protein